MFSGLRSPWQQPFVGETVLQEALRAVETPEGVQASSRRNFKGAVFGRDSLEVGIDVVAYDRELARRIVLSVARHIGVRTEPLSEEEPGKGLHEHRSTTVGGAPIEGEQRAIFEKLSPLWGGTDTYFTYFGAADTGALYLVLIERWTSLWGNQLLSDSFVHARTGDIMTIAQTVVMSANWYCHKIDASDIGLVEFERSNPNGLWFQVMRDGHTGMVDSTGKQANANAPIAAIEIQGVAFSGLRSAARLTDDEGLAKQWNAAADSLREATFSRFWMNDVSYFSRALYRSVAGNEVAVVDSLDSAAGELLRDELFDDMSANDKQRYVGSLVNELYSENFLTDVGVRMLSMKHRHLFDYWTYQGCNTVWPTVVKRIADGLHRQGLHELGDDMDARLLDGCDRAREFPEFFFVDDEGVAALRLADQPGPDVRETSAPNVPMTIQAWTASAAFGSFRRSGEPKPVAEGWAEALTEQVGNRLWSPHTFFVDQEAGSRLEDAFFDSHGGQPTIK